MKKNILLILSVLFFYSQNIFSQHILENNYDVKEYILDLQIENNSDSIRGNVIMNAISVTNLLDTIVVELTDNVSSNQTYMLVDSVLLNGVLCNYSHYNDLIFIIPSISITQGQNFSTQIFYHGKSIYYSCGIYKENYANSNHTVSFSEPSGSDYWWPCKQVLTDKADSVTIFITTDSINLAASNGLLKSTELLSNGKVKYKWQTNYPVESYLISFVVGEYTEHITYAQLANSMDSVLIQSFLLPESDRYQVHLRAIEKTKDLIYLYSELLGDYPFKDEKYGYAVGNSLRVSQNQTICTIGYETFDTISNYYANGGMYHYIIAHELAHQYFGNYVSNSKWKYLWLSEGFVSYMEYVALQNLESQQKADEWIINAHDEVKKTYYGSIDVPDLELSDTYAGLSYRLHYKKAASIIHTLRYEINNDSVFYEVFRTYLSTYANSYATTEDFRQIAESVSGMNLYDFFQQWYYGSGYPKFEISYTQDNDTLKINSIQTGSYNSTPLYKTHFDLMLSHANGDTIVRLYQNTNNDSFNIVFPYVITSLKFDPHHWLINKHNSLINNITESDNNIDFIIYPNPTKDNITIINKSNENLIGSILEIYDLNGKLISKYKLLLNQNTISLSNLSSGIYIVKIVNKDKVYITSKFIKE